MTGYTREQWEEAPEPWFSRIHSEDRGRVEQQMHGHLAVGGYGHSSIHIWSPDGVLLGYGGQTSNIRHIFDEANMEQMIAEMRARMEQEQS